jgi:hypothetical protein
MLLSDLLRSVLEGVEAEEVPLARELEYLRSVFRSSRSGLRTAWKSNELRADRHNRAAIPFLKRLAPRSGGKTVLVDVADIDWVERAKLCSAYAGKLPHLLHVTMKTLEKSLDPNCFLGSTARSSQRRVSGNSSR